MKKSVFCLFTLVFLSSILLEVAAQPAGAEAWSKHKAKKWFKKKEWLGGLQLQPHQTVDILEFAKQYHANKPYWDAAFTYLKNTDLGSIAKGKHPIDGENVFASVSADSSKDFDKTKWESHRKYIDLQYIIDGEETMGVYPVTKATITKAYDENRDVANYEVDGKLYSGKPGKFFLFFPSDAHRPNITPGGNKVVKKIVIKIRSI